LPRGQTPWKITEGSDPLAKFMRRNKIMKSNLSLQILPVVEESEIYRVVDKVIEYIKSTGLNYVVGPMETTIEGELDDLLEIVKKAQKICCDAGAKRVVTIVKIDYKPGGVTMEEKIGKWKN